MSIWSSEIKDLEHVSKSMKGAFPELEKELVKLIGTDDENMLLVYSRRCLEVIITWLSEHELKRDRGTEPLQRIIDKLNKEKKVPHNIIVSMLNVNSMSTFGAHPKEFELKQIKPVLLNLTAVLEWYLKYMQGQKSFIEKSGTSKEIRKDPVSQQNSKVKTRKKILMITSFVFIA